MKYFQHLKQSDPMDHHVESTPRHTDNIFGHNVCLFQSSKFVIVDQQPASGQRCCQWWRTRLGCGQRWMSAAPARSREVRYRGHVHGWTLTQCEFGECAVYLGQSARRVFTSSEAGKEVKTLWSITTNTKNTNNQNSKQNLRPSQARESMQPEPSAGKHVTFVKRAKIINRRQAREMFVSIFMDWFWSSRLHYVARFCR